MTTEMTAKDYLANQRLLNYESKFAYYHTEKGTGFKLLGASGDYSDPKIHLIVGDNYGRDIIAVDLDDPRKSVTVEDITVNYGPRIDWEVEVKNLKDGFKQVLYRAELFITGENLASVRVYMDRGRYGRPQDEVIVSINWSACGSQPVEFAKEFMGLMQKATEIAGMLEWRYKELRRQFEWDKEFDTTITLEPKDEK